MRRVSSAEFIRNFSALSDAALNEPLLISRHKRDRLVVLGIDLYRDRMASISSSGAPAADRGDGAQEGELFVEHVEEDSARCGASTGCPRRGRGG